MHYSVRNCIKCGKRLVGSKEKPAVYSGHFLIDGVITVSAGACFNHRCNKRLDKLLQKCVDGYFGAWRPKYGVVEDKRWQ